MNQNLEQSKEAIVECQKELIKMEEVDKQLKMHQEVVGKQEGEIKRLQDDKENLNQNINQLNKEVKKKDQLIKQLENKLKESENLNMNY